MATDRVLQQLPPVLNLVDMQIRAAMCCMGNRAHAQALEGDAAALAPVGEGWPPCACTWGIQDDAQPTYIDAPHVHQCKGIAAAPNKQVR